MSSLKRYFKSVGTNWKIAWQKKKFRYTLFAGLFLMTVILACYPFFFQYIEDRKGYLFRDPVLKLVAAHDVYIPVFFFIWSCAALMFVSAIRNPGVLLTFLVSYIFLSIIRMLAIFLFPLEPPAGIISLIDPLSNYFYGAKFITRDLFFSGHVSTLFLMYLCQQGKLTRTYTLIASLCVSILVLIQHIHYSIDVLFAFPFAYGCYKCGKDVANQDA
jgi:hypothetical protein